MQPYTLRDLPAKLWPALPPERRNGRLFPPVVHRSRTGAYYLQGMNKSCCSMAILGHWLPLARIPQRFVQGHRAAVLHIRYARTHRRLVPRYMHFLDRTPQTNSSRSNRAPCRLLSSALRQCASCSLLHRAGVLPPLSTQGLKRGLLPIIPCCYARGSRPSRLQAGHVAAQRRGGWRARAAQARRVNRLERKRGPATAR